MTSTATTSNTAVALFSFNNQQVRTVKIDGSPWFVAADVCKILGHTNVSQAIVDADIPGADKAQFNLGLPGKPPTIITRAAVNLLILNSRKPAAVQFKDWLAREVIPALQDDGLYVMGEEKVKTGEMTDDELTLLVLERLKGKVERWKEEAGKQQRRAEEAEAAPIVFPFNHQAVMPSIGI